MIRYVEASSLRELQEKVNAEMNEWKGVVKGLGGPVPDVRRIDATRSTTVYIQAIEVE